LEKGKEKATEEKGSMESVSENGTEEHVETGNAAVGYRPAARMARPQGKNVEGKIVASFFYVENMLDPSGETRKKLACQASKKSHPYPAKRKGERGGK